MKIVGAIAAVGAAVAVAGLGTFGGFTDTTSPVGTKVDTGVVSIDVSRRAVRRRPVRRRHDAGR